jgi:hypothetical protein
MLIDSGADISVISKQTGIDLGLTILPEDYQQAAEGVGGGTINYLTKVILIEIDNQCELRVESPVRTAIW